MIFITLKTLNKSIKVTNLIVSYEIELSMFLKFLLHLKSYVFYRFIEVSFTKLLINYQMILHFQTTLI